MESGRRFKLQISLQARKAAASCLHLAFLILMFAGIGIMYLNDNFGVGLAEARTAVYEETGEFSAQFNQDLEDLFFYIEYHEVFGDGGSIDVTKKMLQMTFGPNETEEFSLAQIISYLQLRGYQLNEAFQYVKVKEPEQNVSSREGYVEWSASEPDKHYSYTVPGAKRMALEDEALGIMDVLNRYYATYNRLMTGSSNLHYKIEYMDEESNPKRAQLFTNDSDLDEENVKELGRYAYLSGNSVFYDTNMNTITLSTISALAANNPYEGNTYYLLAGVDTDYPMKDVYQNGQANFLKMQRSYITGFVLMTVGGLVAALTLLYLLVVSGHRRTGDPEIVLHGFDRTSTEVGILMFAALTLLALVLSRQTLVRIAHLVMAEDAWAFSERVIYAAVLYLGALLGGFSLLRRYKAGVLWQDSLLCRWSERFSIFATRQSFTGRLTMGFLAYLAVSTGLVSLVWLLWDRVYLSKRTIHLLMLLVAVVWAGFNLWIFYVLFKRAAERDVIRDAVERLAAGDTHYQMELAQFEGQERALAEGINNIGMGLETALQEKVKSERLKADLITNVSHDIKTPLTSIINYVNLIKREQIQDEKILGYLDVLDQKSQRLKTLTEDLVEASKASSGNLKLEISDINLTQLVYQTNGEFEEKFASRHLELVTTAPEEPLVIEADGRRLWRVLENLYNNTYKYAMENSRVYVDIVKIGGGTYEGGKLSDQVQFTIKNMSANPLNFRADELTERFVRGDVARTTEGSGLGLSIARSLTELQKGRFGLTIDGDLFKAQLTFDIKSGT